MTTPQDIARAMAMIRECDDAASLFSRGLAAARTVRHDYSDAVVVMSLLALGAEKMVKLTIGLAHRGRGQPWPSKTYMQRIGHRVREADQIARPLLDMHAGSAPGWLDARKAAVARDPVLPQVLEALDRFGDAGRFYYLDVLAVAPQPVESPQALWTELTTDIATHDAALLADLASGEHAEEARRRINEIIVTTLTAWWQLYAAAWCTGAVGDEAKRYAGEITLQPAR